MRRRGLQLVCALLLLLGLGCELRVRRSYGILIDRGHLLVLVLVWLAAGTVATLIAVRTRPRVRAALALVAVVTVVTQGVALASGPQLSDDLYRYTWDAEVGASGTDVYLYPPDAPQLVHLRTPYLWPDAQQCAVKRPERARTARADPFAGVNPPGCTRINRPSVRTLYPPVAQLAFRVAAAVTPDSWNELQVQAPAAFAALLLLALIVLLLRRAGQSPAWALLYAATPLSGLETTMDGHVDVVAAVCTLGVVAVLASRRIAARPRLQRALVGIGLAAAILVKLYPAVFVPAALTAWQGLSRRIVVLAWTLLAGVALYARHLIATDGRVLGYLPGYLSENGYNNGSRFVLVNQLGLSSALTTDLVAVAVLLVLAVPALRLSEHADWQQVARRMLATVGTVMLLTNPGDAWYCLALVALAAVTRRPEWMVVVAANYVSYVDAILKWHSNWPLLAYALAAAVAILTTLGRRLGGVAPASAGSSASPRASSGARRGSARFGWA